ncbi:MAG: tRNA threonylcarbamoyladenosine dehydratase [Bacteroidaceae bacterium]|nr:tRNA threonylcarbamoyladenosine dehydratase [Bacteroidaceae bacterium]
MTHEIFSRSARLLGTEAMERMAHAKVIVFGVGGVGSWVAEALVRTGFQHITIVDSDVVAESNINRQLMATTLTVGQPKVAALRTHLLTLNPAADVVAMQMAYTAATAQDFGLQDYDYIIDCIDSLEHKASLILHATQTGAKFYSSMGAALKLDPTKIEVAEFWKVKGCPLGAALRRRFKKAGTLPKRRFRCVFSQELKSNHDLPTSAEAQGMWDARKAQINGSLVHITAIFGMTLAGMVVQDVAAHSSAQTHTSE